MTNTLTTTTSTHTVNLEKTIKDAMRALELADTPQEAKQGADHVTALKAYAKRINAAFPVQFALGRLQLEWQRKAGEILAETDLAESSTSTGCTLQQVGVERTQSHRWQKLATIPVPQWEVWMANSEAATTLPTQTAALKLARTLQWDTVRTTTPPPTTNQPHQYTARSVANTVDENQRAAFVDALTEELVAVINKALDTCTPKQVYVWRNVTGVNPDGSATPAYSTATIAKHMGTTREAVRTMWVEADRHIKGALFLDRWMEVHRLKTILEANGINE